jgi:CRISPR-associated protein Cmr1
MMKPAALTRKALVSSGLFEIRRTVAVISPVFGGGVDLDPRELRRHLKVVDPITPIRGSSIRGQLRFWWRATRGIRFDSLREMRESERIIWGAASVPSPVAIEVGGKARTRELKVFDLRQNENSKKWNPTPANGMADIAYAAFPLQPKAGQQAVVQPGVLHLIEGTFDLIIRGPNAAEDDVQSALAAWLAFGGIGGRTRRGFGAVWAENSHTPAEVLARLTIPGAPPAGVPGLAGAKLVVLDVAYASGLEALKNGLASLRRFRQGGEVGRNRKADMPGNKKPVGRSRWPEPEAIRALTNNPQGKHSERFVNVDKFPRAEFGLPIIFHFQEEHGVQEPEETTLKPVGFERMASPLIIRPFRRHDGKFECLALVLQRPEHPLALELKRKSGQPSFLGAQVSHSLSRDEAARVKPLNGNPDPLAAFLNYFAGDQS